MRARKALTLVKHSARTLSCGIAVIAVLGIGLTGMIAGPAQAAPSAPSWDDVRAAKADAADAQSTVDELSTRLQSLQDAADEAQVAELQAGQTYALASSQQQEAQSTLDDLSAQAKRAKRKADDSARQVAGLVVELSRTGGGDLSTSMLIDASDSKDLLYRVGTMTHLSERSATVLAEARTDQNTVDSIAAQQSAATKALAKATDTTKHALDDANDTAAAAQSRVEKEQAQQAEVLEQLAFLKGTSVQTETAYWSAQQAKRAEAQLASQTNGDAGSSGGTQTGGTGSTGSTGGGQTGGTQSGGGQTGGTATTPTKNSGGTSTPNTPAKPNTPAAPAKPATPAQPAAPAKPATPAKPSTPVTTPTAPAAPSTPSRAAGAIAYARAQIGDAYVFGGAGPNQWDCSGLVMMAYNSQGIATGGHNVVWQYNYFKSIGRLVPLSQRQPGDILFYSSNGSVSGAYHDSIVTSYGTMVEAANPQRGVLERAIWTPSQLLPYVARPSGSL
ncbi:Cell wall-associated hydrolase, NlpC family [Curtobacterium sp. UNCCL20]|uniref:C40 family peptidase n=1 Tax=Curtobacterium sp. UNCCL20 TaxID=1502773 RepID=UPI0008914ABF|nr:NlpC/P60 family protein [Curtobacterium sp. UNCCL20]SDQ19342.1 Cell wall-associated hydrolase, NlpC family [Curtobacterium sp. UNCCL20]